MTLKVVPAESGPAFRQFMELPWAIYRDDPYRVPPLNRDVRDLLSPAHPFHRQAERALSLAVSGSMPAGRIAAILNRKHNEFNDDRVGFFGFFECLDNQEVSGALLREAERWIRDRGMDTSRGPVNPSTNEECSLLVQNYLSPPLGMMTCNPPYYADLLEGQGHAKEKDLFACWYHVGRRIPERLDRMVRKAREREPDLVARSLDMKRFDEDLKAIKVVSKEAWEKNWGFVPMSDEELDSLAKRLKSLLAPNIVNLAFIGGEPAGFVMALPDFNQVLKVLNGRPTPLGVWRVLRASRRIRSGRCLPPGVREKFRRRGIESLLFELTWQGAIDMGYRYGEISWILEDNQPIHDAATRAFSAEHCKTYRIYQKRLPSPDGLH